MKTELIEFKNKTNDTLRGILLSGEKTEKVVLMCGGFERSAITEKKFKVLADELAKNNIASLRFDYSGCGLSDGYFSKITVEKMSSDLKNAFEIFRKKTICENISVIAHSLSACVIANSIKNLSFEKIILIAPALNQKDLLRFWFTVSRMKKLNSNIEIIWQNFKDYLDEGQFQADMQRTDKMTKANYIYADYFLENKEKDYSELLMNNKNILIIHGDKDDKVPLESLTTQFQNKIVVKGGDHDLERPDMLKQWKNEVINFIK